MHNYTLSIYAPTQLWNSNFLLGSTSTTCRGPVCERSCLSNDTDAPYSRSPMSGISDWTEPRRDRKEAVFCRGPGADFKKWATVLFQFLLHLLCIVYSLLSEIFCSVHVKLIVRYSLQLTSISLRWLTANVTVQSRTLFIPTTWVSTRALERLTYVRMLTIKVDMDTLKRLSYTCPRSVNK